MRQRLAGCVAGVVAVLAWEALTSTGHPRLTLPGEPVAADPIVALSEGVLAQPAAAHAVVLAPAPVVPRAANVAAAEELVPEAPCEVAAAPCDSHPATPRARAGRDAGVERAPTSACSTGPG